QRCPGALLQRGLRGLARRSRTKPAARSRPWRGRPARGRGRRRRRGRRRLLICRSGHLGIYFAVPVRVTAMNARLVVLVSGEGTSLQALIDASASPDYGATVVAVGADRDNIGALDRAAKSNIRSFTLKVRDFRSRQEWDQALTANCASYEPDL